jgi:hypothetical protein
MLMQTMANGKMLQETCVKMSKGASRGESMLEVGHFK